MTSNAGPVFGPRGMECTLLVLTITIPADPLDPESRPLSFDTWTIGHSQRSALSEWKRLHRTLAGQLAGVRVVTPAPVPKLSHDAVVTRAGRLKYA